MMEASAGERRERGCKERSWRVKSMPDEQQGEVRRSHSTTCMYRKTGGEN